MKVLILAGGYGTRMSEYTHVTPKPMVMLGGKPLIWHIMQQYAYYGHTEFIIALGYKGEEFKKYFLNFSNLNSDFTIDIGNGDIKFHKRNTYNWKITLVDTGLNTLTGGRIRKLKKYFATITYFRQLLYTDGALLQQHHLPGLHKLTSTNLVEVDSCTYRLAVHVCSIPLN